MLRRQRTEMVTRQFDVVQNPNARTRKFFPFLVVLQHDLIETSATVVVAPLVAEGAFKPATRLHPVVVVEGARYILATHDLGATARDNLSTIVTNLATHRDDIIAAIDMVFTGI